MRRASHAVIALAGLVLAGAPALAADSGPVIVIPGRPGVPVIINGIDVSGGVVEGDWGLYKPAIITPRIVFVPLVTPEFPEGSPYYPAFGRKPGYGRFEIEPPANRRLPPPAPSYRHFWGSESDPTPASLDPPAPMPFIVAPQIKSGRRPSARPRSHATRPQPRGQSNVQQPTGPPHEAL